MMVIASVNIGINIKSQKLSQEDILTIKLSYDRFAEMALNQVIMRVLLNIANGYESD
jgi:hypothetical protein